MAPWHHAPSLPEGVNTTSEPTPPILSIAWRLDRARAVRYLSCAYLHWTPAEQRRRVRRLFPQTTLDWRSIDALATAGHPLRRAPEETVDRLPGLPATIRQLRRWADLAQAPANQAAIALAAASILADWLQGARSPKACVPRPQTQPL